MHKYIVVGRGLIGSAAARHLAESVDGVACVGPDEPGDRQSHAGVFASHYDEGRMTRILDPEREWALTAKRSIERYEDLERRSGIRFFTPSGYLGLGQPSSDYNDRCMASGVAEGSTAERLDAARIRERFPYLDIDDETDGVWEAGTAGHISPRAAVEAETVLAERAGAEIIRKAATAIHPVSGALDVELDHGAVVRGERVLVATGAFTAACGLVPADLKLRVYGRTVVLVRIEGEVASTLRDMPTMIHASSGAYILPPIPYPDGHTYLKIGIGTDADKRLGSLADLQTWFKSAGSEDNRREFTAFLTGLVPALGQATVWRTDTCAVTATESGYPIIDFVDAGRLAVVVGGNGKGAKGADEWGRISANLLRGEDWDQDLPRARFTLPG